MTITGSAGKDTVIATTANDNAAVKSMTGVETLELNAAGGATAFDFAKTSGITLVKTDDDGTARDITLTDLTDGTAIEIETGIADSGVIVDMANKAAAGNTLSMEIETVAGAGHTIDIDIDEVETTTIKIDTASTLDLAGLSMTTGTSALNLTGDSNVIVSALHQDVTTVDASGMSNGGSVTQNARSSTAAVTYTGSDGDDTFIMMNKGDVINGSTGLNDKLDINFAGILGGISVDLSSTSDQVDTMDGSANAAVQIGFEDVDLAGHTGYGASVVGSAGANEITGTASRDSISAGKGDDIIHVNTGTVANSDVMDGGAGADTLQIAAGLTTTIDVDSELQNVETVALTTTGTLVLTGQTEAFTITAGAGTSTITSGTGNDTITLSNDSGNDTVKISNTSLDTVGGFTVSEDHLVFTGLSGIDGVTGNTVAVAANAASNDLADGKIIIFAKAADMTGSFAITQFTNMTHVAAQLAGSLTETNTESYVAVVNDLVGDEVYAYFVSNVAGGSIDASEVTLVAQLDDIGATAFAATEIA
jgi:hypothetical protein